MDQTRGAGAALIALAALLAAAALAAALLTPRPWAVRVGAPGDAYVLSNSFPPEGGDAPLRWSRDVTDLRLHGAYAGPVGLEARLYRDPAAAAGAAWPLELRGPAAPLARFEAAPGWRRYQVILPPGAAAAPLTLVSPTFRPGGRDERALGVALAELRAAPLAGAAPVAHALGRAAWLAALLALAGAAAWLLDAWSLGAAGARGRPLRAAAVAGGLGATAAAWAWLAPLSFAWALPTRWDGITAGAALVAAAAAASRCLPPALPPPFLLPLPPLLLLRRRTAATTVVGALRAGLGRCTKRRGPGALSRSAHRRGSRSCHMPGGGRWPLALSRWLVDAQLQGTT